ncbi:MAG TPA: flippase-like domain-containing protein [Rhodospirillaceae bacterium]|nr:flippase-like domain-containing protein [Rhodospirillaceae bacterium]
MIKRWGSLASKLALTGGAIWYLQSKVDLRAAWEAGRHLPLQAFLGALMLQVVQVCICAGRWQLVLRAIGAWLPFTKACELFCIGNFFGQVLPGAVGGDAVRMWKTRQQGLDLATSVNSVMLERIATVFALVFLVTLLEPLLLDRVKDRSAEWLFPLLCLGAALGIAVLMTLDRVPVSLRQWRLVRGFAKLAGDTRRLFLSPGYGLATMLVAITGHINLAMVVWVLALGLGVGVSLIDCLVLVPPVILVATLPLSIAGWGARELAMVTVFGFVGVAPAEATALSVLFGLVSILIALPGGIFWVMAKDHDVPKDVEGFE